MSENARLGVKADVVILMDVTGSMDPCIEGMKSRVKELTDAMEGEVNVQVDWRAKIIGFRDLEADPEEDWFQGKDNPFVKTAQEIAAQLTPLEARGGGMGPAEIPESALDALEMAMGMDDWINQGEGHRVIVLLTDAPTKPKTVTGKDAMDIAQMASENHFRILIFGPDCKEYRILEKVPKASFVDVTKGGTKKVHRGLENLDWTFLFETLAKTVSEPVSALEESEPSSIPESTDEEEKEEVSEEETGSTDDEDSPISMGEEAGPVVDDGKTKPMSE